ncbi:sprouty-related, EVH1 domain-containing protein 2-like [Lytechinus pictus]|uniref:sprouty-related, EVH1 domain-containing protein 2-like n=1 Tax=Lytechinus pictus TaxID=7653 RepID=UPI0030BA0D3E
MEERDTPLDENSCLTKVRAQVMTREDGGWVPVGGGGVSIVGIYKLTKEDCRVEHVVVGTTMEDNTRVLEFNLRKGVQYYRGSHLFHHWRTPDEKKCGLTFYGPADARAFERGFGRAVSELQEGSSSESSYGLDDSDEDVPVPRVVDPLLSRECVFHDYQNTPSTCVAPKDGGGKLLKDILTQPANKDYTCISGYTYPHNNQGHLHMVHYVTRKRDDRRPLHNMKYAHEGSWVKTATEWHPIRKDLSQDHFKDSYVKIVKKPQSIHEYSYPTIPPTREMDDLKKPPTFPKVVTTQPPPSPPKKLIQKMNKYTEPSQCLHCSQYFDPESNRKGDCPEAPDEVSYCINFCSCLCAAQCMLYHCMSNSEGDFPSPCSCDTGESQFCRRWFGLAALSFFVPCLWCYPPLKCCHWLGTKCGCCGGRHKAK